MFQNVTKCLNNIQHFNFPFFIIILLEKHHSLQIESQQHFENGFLHSQ